MGKQAGIREVAVGANGGLVFHKAQNREGKWMHLELEKSKNKNKELGMSFVF